MGERKAKAAPGERRPGPRQALGRWGEQQAALFLEAHGFTVLARNARTPYGEIDLVARQGEALVFVEVKTRSSQAFGLPEEAVDRRKREHLAAAAEAYTLEHPDLPTSWRVDVVAVECAPGRPVEITHFENVIN